MQYYVVINHMGAYFNPNKLLFEPFSGACTMSYEIASRAAALTHCIMRQYNPKIDYK